MRRQLEKLREKMKEAGISAYVVPTEDYHASEYVGDYFKCRAYVSGFTGSAGTLAVTMDKAGLWTDGRYFLQAGGQLQGSGIDLYKMGMPGVPTLDAFLKEELPTGGVLGFDGRTVSAAQGKAWEKLAAEKSGSVKTDRDLAGEIWEDRPALAANPARTLDVSYTGMSTRDKLGKLREAMKEKGAAAHLLTSLDDIAWLFNIRGTDVAFNPVVMAYAFITETEAVLYAAASAFSGEDQKTLLAQGVSIKPYFAVYEDVKAIPAGTTVLLDEERVNDHLVRSIPQGVSIVSDVNPTTMWKAVKNETELAWARRVHVRDGAALTKFLYWIKKQAGKEAITEISAADRLEAFRKEQEGFLGLSFETIAGDETHGAIIHYSATPETDIPVAAQGVLLVDSGAQYEGGTTDVTRTFALGPVTDREKQMFTLVLAGMLRLGAARFPEGTGGVNLDILARQPLWERGLDYRHGTGHGVGSFLNVHEGPNRLAQKDTNARYKWGFVPGMVTSDEPGYYEDGAFGIRCENLMVCVPDGEGDYGKFCRFEFLTWAPFDPDLLDVSLFTERDKELYNAYQAEVYEKIAPLLDEEERAWLKEVTKAV